MTIILEQQQSQELPINQILQGDALSVLKSFPSKSIRGTCLTSPPYWKLRDYQHPDQLGQEPDFRDYTDKLVAIFDEVQRVLTDDSSCWVVIADTYNRSKKGNTNGTGKRGGVRQKEGINDYNFTKQRQSSIPEGSLCMIPSRFAIEMVDHGWTLHNIIIWRKENCLDQMTVLYAKTQKGITVQTLKDLVRLEPSTVELWDGKKWNRVKQWIRNYDPQGIKEITIRNGEVIRCTSNHRIPTVDNALHNADDLRVGDTLLLSTLPNNDKNVELIPDEVGWFIGLYLAEGSIGGDGAIQISGHSKEIARFEKLSKLCSKYDARCYVYSYEGFKSTIKISSKVLRSILDTYLGGTKANNKHLSNKVWNRNNHFLASILMGYLSGDGHFDSENNRWRLGFTSNGYLASDLRTICARLGYSIKLQKAFARIGDRTFKTYKGEIRFSKSYHWNTKTDTEIVKIEDSEGGIFYDVVLEQEPHLFATASGILVHNSMPNSAGSRFTPEYEYVFFFTKSHTKTLYWINKKTGRVVKEKPPKPVIGIEGEDWDWATTKKGRKYKRTNWEGQRYFFEPQYEPLKTPPKVQQKGIPIGGKNKGKGYGNRTYSSNPWVPNGLGKNMRCVWTINTKGFKEAHYATYPEDLCKIPIKASCPQYICKKCGLPKNIRYEEIRINTRPGNNTGTGKSGKQEDPNASLHNSDLSKYRQQIVRIPMVGGYSSPEYNGQAIKDYSSAKAQNPSDAKRSILKSMFTQKNPSGMTSCDCGVEFEPGIILDPFFGSGTTGLVAQKMGRNFIGIELSPQYIQIARKRLSLDHMRLEEVC